MAGNDDQGDDVTTTEETFTERAFHPRGTGKPSIGVVDFSGEQVDSLRYKLDTVLADRKVIGGIARKAIEALRMADAYLDGFVWLTEPEVSELAAIRAASKEAQAAWLARMVQ